jgi:hypothetical protein
MPKANSPNTIVLSRRALMLTSAGLVTANVAAAATAVRRARDGAGLGGPEADAQLFACWREYLKLEIELSAAQVARDSTSWNARRAYPPKPDCIGSGGVKVNPFKITPDVELWTATMDMKSGRQPAAERNAEVEAWMQKCNDINIQFGLPELESAFKFAWDRQWAAFARFVATPATTLAGLAVKTSAIFYFEDATRRAWQGIETEQTRLEPEQQILLTLRRDLLRMAGLPDDFAMEFGESNEQYFATVEWSDSASQV